MPEPDLSPPDMTRLSARLSRFAAKSVRTRTLRCAGIEPLASFTFDDIIDTAYSRGAPILERHGAKGTFYIAANLLGAVAADRCFATGEDALDLHRRGHEIGCHTYSHRAVATQSSDGLLADIGLNQAFFTTLAPDLKLESFAYPYNALNLRAKLVLQRQFSSCRGGVPGLNLGHVDLGYLRAVELCDEMIDLARIKAWVAEAAHRKGWLVFLTHGVTDERQAWRSTPALLEGAVAAVRDAGVTIVTVGDAVRRIAASSLHTGALYS